MERTNMRYVTEDDIEEPAQFVSIDVSFYLSYQNPAGGLPGLGRRRRSRGTDQASV